MMLKSVERLLEFVGDMNATEINDHIKACPDGFVVSFHIDGEWLDGWNRAVLATVEKIEREVSERYMELPVDADGVPIRIGDVMVLQHEVEEKPDVVQALTWDGEDWYFTSIEGFFNACGWEHYHAPTVEDVLREVVAEVQLGINDVPHIVTEYAKRLRLAGDDE